MPEKISYKEIISEEELGRLRRELEEAESALAKVRSEKEEIVGNLKPGSVDAAKNFRDYLARLREAEQKAIDALEGWGNAAAEFHKLKD